MEDLSGKIVLVTGASSGIGKELALSFAKNGCNVIAAARRLSNLNSLRDEVEKGGAERGDGYRTGKVAIVAMDVSADEPAIEASAEKAWAAFGGIDVVVNNAGIRGSTTSSIELDEAEWQTVMNTNLKGMWLVTKAVVKRMKSAKRAGSIINISSTSGLERSLLPLGVAYGVSKAAVNHLTKNLALELGQYQIRVNSISSGMFQTEITDKLFTRDWIKPMANKIVPLGRWGVIDPDLTSLVLLLSSNASSYVTGNVFIVDGGQSLPSVPIWSSL